MSSVGSAPTSTDSSSSQSAASTAPSSVGNSPSGSPSPSAASSLNGTPASSVASSPTSTAPTSPSSSQAPSPTLKPQSQPPEPTVELEIPDNDALYLLLAEAERYAEITARVNDQQKVARWARGARKKDIKPGVEELMPPRFPERTEPDQQNRVDDIFKETLEDIMRLSAFDGIYDNDSDEGNNNKSRPGKLGISGTFWKTQVSQAETNRIAESFVRKEKPETVSTHQLASVARTIIDETRDLRMVHSALPVVAALVNTLDPYSEKDRPIFTQFPVSLQNMFRTGYDMVDHSLITPWEAGVKKTYPGTTIDGRRIQITGVIREPADFGGHGSRYVNSVRRHRDTVGPTRTGFEPTERETMNTERSYTGTTPVSWTSNNRLSAASKKPSGVRFADQSQTIDGRTALNGHSPRMDDRDRQWREVLDRFRRDQASQTGTSCAQEAGMGHTGLAQTAPLASYG